MQIVHSEQGWILFLNKLNGTVDAGEKHYGDDGSDREGKDKAFTAVCATFILTRCAHAGKPTCAHIKIKAVVSRKEATSFQPSHSHVAPHYFSHFHIWLSCLGVCSDSQLYFLPPADWTAPLLPLLTCSLIFFFTPSLCLLMCLRQKRSRAFDAQIVSVTTFSPGEAEGVPRRTVIVHDPMRPFIPHEAPNATPCTACNSLFQTTCSLFMRV